MNDKVYALHVMSLGLDADVRLNGHSVACPRGFTGSVEALFATAHLVEGANLLEAFLRPSAPDPETEEDPSFELKLFRFSRDTRPAEIDVLVGYTYTENEAGLLQSASRRVLAHRFFVRERYGVWRFLHARPPGETPAWAWRGRVGELHRLLVARDLDGLVQSLSVRTSELAAAMSAAPAEVEAELREKWEMRFGAGDFSVDGLDPALSFELALGGRAVTPRDTAGRTALRGRANRSAWSLPIAMANLDGTVEVVR